MAANDYHFITHWQVQAKLQDVVDIIGDAESLPRWWPAVYLDVDVLEKGDAQGIGKRIRLYTKGWLPYTLRWEFRVSEATQHGFTLIAEGDFTGRGIWTFAEQAGCVDITYDWRIQAQKPLLKRLSVLFKPIFAMNHRWAMQKGEESLQLELARRTASPAAREQLPPPPAPTPVDPLKWIVFVLRHRKNGIS